MIGVVSWGMTEMAGSPAHSSGFAYGGVPVRNDADRSIRALVKGNRNQQSVNASLPCTNKNARASGALALRELSFSRQSPWCLAYHVILSSAALTGVNRVYTIYSRELKTISSIRSGDPSTVTFAVLIFQVCHFVIRWCPRERRPSWAGREKRIVTYCTNRRPPRVHPQNGVT